MDDLAKRKLDNFFGNFKKHNFRAKEIVIRADEDPQGIFYLTGGMVKMYAISARGEELVINIFRPVSFFPMAWVLNNSISHYYFEAVSPVTAWKAPKEEFLKFIKNEPEILFDLVKRIYAGLEGYFSRMEYLMSGSARSKLIMEILISAKRFGKKEGDAVTVDLKLTEKDLASQSGMTRETVSREISKLKEKGILTYQKNILVIKDLYKLESELASD
ncbi:MAG TPA: Crp/Fnr family transcriptional regulator [Patescibacteria group bacterium]|nr:Crp/Fnr family transcriptional regulator [Patescibacteria group bacterium]